MRLTRSVLALAGLLAGTSLTACALPPGGLPLIDQIQQAVTTACDFLPTAETVADLLLGDWPVADQVTAIATAICDAIGSPSPMGRSSIAPAGPPIVQGVPIEGVFV